VLDGEVVLSWDRAREETCGSGDSFHILKPEDLTVSAASNGAKLVVVEGLDEA